MKPNKLFIFAVINLKLLNQIKRKLKKILVTFFNSQFLLSVLCVSTYPGAENSMYATYQVLSFVNFIALFPAQTSRPCTRVRWGGVILALRRLLTFSYNTKVIEPLWEISIKFHYMIICTGSLELWIRNVCRDRSETCLKTLCKIILTCETLQI